MCVCVCVCVCVCIVDVASEKNRRMAFDCGLSAWPSEFIEYLMNMINKKERK